MPWFEVMNYRTLKGAVSWLTERQQAELLYLGADGANRTVKLLVPVLLDISQDGLTAYVTDWAVKLPSGPEKAFSINPPERGTLLKSRMGAAPLEQLQRHWNWDVWRQVDKKVEVVCCHLYGKQLHAILLAGLLDAFFYDSMDQTATQCIKPVFRAPFKVEGIDPHPMRCIYKACTTHKTTLLEVAVVGWWARASGPRRYPTTISYW